MKKYLLPNTGSYYKANLHCHSTVSDGRLTPEEIKEAYKKLGYSVVAYTDHEVMIPHHELTDDSFLAMTGYELEAQEYGKTWAECKRAHMCFVALDPKIEKQVCWNEEKNGYTWGNCATHAGEVKYDESEAHFVRDYNGETVSEMMKRGRDNGFFVTYNHPTWSNEDYSIYMKYNNMHAMEMVNYGCLIEGYDEYNSRVYDDMLKGGKRLYCICADDNHHPHQIGGGFTMINADKLTYESIASSLVDGKFYCSEAPLINELYYEDGYVRIKCSDAVRVCFITDIIHARVARSENGEPVTSASFKIPDKATYFRLIVIDKEGKHACTNAFFIDELQQ